MVVYFDEGVNRVWYRPIGFKTGLSVQLQLWSPDLNKKELQTFTELEEGLYYLDYNFSCSGTWVGIVYENGTKVGSSTFGVGIQWPGIVRYIKKA